MNRRRFRNESRAMVRNENQSRLRNQAGQGLIEYMILLALVVLVCVSTSKLLGQKINTKFNEIRNQIDEGIPVRLSP
jgi:Flp pilus assembly pilin Flp